MSNNTNWRSYVGDPKFLIALLPGLEIARDNLNKEIESIRDAVQGGKQVALPVHDGAVEPVRLLKRSYVRKTVGKKKDRGFVADPSLTQLQFVRAVALFYGGKATNAQLRAAAWKNRKRFGTLNSAKRLSVAVADAIKKGLVTRVGEGEIQAVAQ